MGAEEDVILMGEEGVAALEVQVGGGEGGRESRHGRGMQATRERRKS